MEQRAGETEGVMILQVVLVTGRLSGKDWVKWAAGDNTPLTIGEAMEMIKTVPCPRCEAGPGEVCVKHGEKGDICFVRAFF